jgi:hypothetical protein
MSIQGSYLKITAGDQPPRSLWEPATDQSNQFWRRRRSLTISTTAGSSLNLLYEPQLLWVRGWGGDAGRRMEGAQSSD